MLLKFGIALGLGVCIASGAQAAENESCIDLEQPVFQELYQKQNDGFNVPYCKSKDMTVYEQFLQWQDVFNIPAPLINLIYEYGTMVGSKAALEAVYDVSGIKDDGISTQVIGAIRNMGYSKFMEAYKNNALARLETITQNSSVQAIFLEQLKSQLDQYTIEESKEKSS